MQLSLHMRWKVPAVAPWTKCLIFLHPEHGRRGRGHRGSLNVAVMIDSFYRLPRPSFANAESLPFLLIYLCHWSKVHKLLLRAGSFLIGPGFAIGKVITEGSFCCDFWCRFRGTDVVNISIPS